MKWKALVIPFVLGVTLCACASAPLKVPVLGDAALLAGRWDGQFKSMDGTRSGTIMFDLRPGQDTAYGDVLLVPREWALQHRPWEDRAEMHAHPELIAISFVRVSGNVVRGTLEPYRDPMCGCRVRTVFDGVLRNDVIDGTYETRHVETHAVHGGTWTVRRSRPYADTGVDGHHAIGKTK